MLRIVCTTLIICLLSSGLIAQSTKKKKEKRPRFVALSLLSLAQVNESTSFATAGKVGFYVVPNFYIGGTAKLIFIKDDFFAPRIVEDPELGYWAAMFGYRLFEYDGLRVNLIATAGIGTAEYERTPSRIRDRVLMAMPGIEAEYYVGKKLAITAELGHRTIRKAEAGQLPTDGQLDGFEASIYVKFGRQDFPRRLRKRNRR